MKELPATPAPRLNTYMGAVEKSIARKEEDLRDLLKETEKTLVQGGYVRDFDYQSDGALYPARIRWCDGSFRICRKIPQKSTTNPTTSVWIGVQAMTGSEMLLVAKHLERMVETAQSNARIHLGNLESALEWVETAKTRAMKSVSPE